MPGLLVYSVNETARKLGLRIESVYRLIDSGYLVAYQTNGKWKVQEKSVEDYLLNHSRKGKTHRDCIH